MSDVAEAVQPAAPGPGPVGVEATPTPEPAAAAAAAEAAAEAAEVQPSDGGEEGAENTVEDVDQELEAMKRKLQQMEAEALALRPEEAAAAGAAKNSEAQEATAAAAVAPAAVADGGGAPDAIAEDAIADADSRSIYVGNVDYNATVDELSAYFSECGTINRVTIMTHKPTGQPKGFAYVEFKDQHAVQNAMILNESMFKGRQLKIVPKRTNVPGVSRGGYRGRGRATRGRGGSYYGRRPRARGRGRWVPY